MSLRVNYVQLRVQTSAGLYGTDLRLNGGLTVIHAPNTSGKSTSLQAILYALGLEQMLSPKREIPLPYAMRTHVEDPISGGTHLVIASYVAVEIENAEGQRITVRRDVVSEHDRRLIHVSFGPKLTEPDQHFPERDYFIFDPGAAKRESGFHRLLAEFLGWSLPTVKRYDGGDTTLYLETLFPLFYVEQKSGWSSIPAPVPTHFRIRDVLKRSVEFILSLETHALELRRQELDLRIGAHRASWSATVDETNALADAFEMRVQGVPELPTALIADVQSSRLEIPSGEKWMSLSEHLASLQERLESLVQFEIPEVEELASEAALELDELSREIQELNAERNDSFRMRQAEIIQRRSTVERIELLEEDIRKNQDARKLERFGSSLGRDLSPTHCPTCEQAIEDALLPQGSIDAVMSVDDNIEYLTAQRGIYKKLIQRSDAAIKDLDLHLLSSASAVREKTARLRALKSDLVAPSHAASAAFIEERLRLDARVQSLTSARERFENLMVRLSEQCLAFADLLSQRAELPESRFSIEDQAKLHAFQESVRRQLKLYGFRTFSPDDLEISEDTYRPQKEGFEIGFELSASDAIRLKWAYQVGLLAVSRQHSTNHPGLLILDEPRQQEAAEASVAGLLREAATQGTRGAQIIIGTSESLESIGDMLRQLPCQLIAFEGYIIQRIES